jgi:Zn-dependent peptidase ImmA (M78 family)
MTKVANFLRSLALSPDEIAVKSRLPSERIRSIIGGEDANLSELRSLARGLKVPLRTFTQSSEVSSDLAMLFRSTSASKPDLGVEIASSFVEAAISILSPRSSPPDWLSKFNPKDDSYDEAARLAENFRLLFMPDRLDEPLYDLPDILVTLGGVILARLESSRFEGASVVANGYAFIFVSPRFSGRMLFTLAHELGHLIAHHKDPQSVVFDLSSQIGGIRRYRPRPEAFADAFASALLMPPRGVGIALRQIRETFHAGSDEIGDVELLCLARLYGVSFEVAAFRCENLGLLPKGGAVTLADFLKRQHGSPEKRADFLGLPKRPTIVIPRVSQNLLAAAVNKIEDGAVSLGWVTDHFACSVNDIYAARAAPEATRGPHH